MSSGGLLHWLIPLKMSGFRRATLSAKPASSSACEAEEVWYILQALGVRKQLLSVQKNTLFFSLRAGRLCAAFQLGKKLRGRVTSVEITFRCFVDGPFGERRVRLSFDLFGGEIRQKEARIKSEKEAYVRGIKALVFKTFAPSVWENKREREGRRGGRTAKFLPRGIVAEISTKVSIVQSILAFSVTESVRF